VRDDDDFGAACCGCLVLLGAGMVLLLVALACLFVATHI
jgi:hypothetical protein